MHCGDPAGGQARRRPIAATWRACMPGFSKTDRLRAGVHALGNTLPYRGAARVTSVKPADNPVLQTIWDIVAMIPHGRVSTYGNVARAAGLARGARQAGYALRMTPPGMRLP